MPKTLIRLVAIALIPCLLADGVTASALKGLPSSTSAAASSLIFSEQAIPAALLEIIPALNRQAGIDQRQQEGLRARVALGLLGAGAILDQFGARHVVSYSLSLTSGRVLLIAVGVTFGVVLGIGVVKYLWDHRKPQLTNRQAMHQSSEFNRLIQPTGESKPTPQPTEPAASGTVRNRADFENLFNDLAGRIHITIETSQGSLEKFAAFKIEGENLVSDPNYQNEAYAHMRLRVIAALNTLAEKISLPGVKERNLMIKALKLLKTIDPSNVTTDSIQQWELDSQALQKDAKKTTHLTTAHDEKIADVSGLMRNILPPVPQAQVDIQTALRIAGLNLTISPKMANAQSIAAWEEELRSLQKAVNYFYEGWPNEQARFQDALAEITQKVAQAKKTQQKRKPSSGYDVHDFGLGIFLPLGISATLGAYAGAAAGILALAWYGRRVWKEVRSDHESRILEAA